MVSKNDIQQVMKDYVQHRDGDRFVLEFSKVSYDIEKRGDSKAVDLSRRVQAKLAEVYAGHMSQTLLYNWAADMAEPSMVAYYYMNVVVAFYDSVNRAAVVEKGFQTWVGSSGRSHGAVFGSVGRPA